MSEQMSDAERSLRLLWSSEVIAIDTGLYERWINSRLGMSALFCSKGSLQWGVKYSVLCGNASLCSC